MTMGADNASEKCGTSEVTSPECALVIVVVCAADDAP